MCASAHWRCAQKSKRCIARCSSHICTVMHVMQTLRIERKKRAQTWQLVSVPDLHTTLQIMQRPPESGCWFAFLITRHRLLPYWYTAAFNASTYGGAIARPLFMDWPSDERARAASDTQWLIGERGMCIVSYVVRPLRLCFDMAHQ